MSSEEEESRHVTQTSIVSLLLRQLEKVRKKLATKTGARTHLQPGSQPRPHCREGGSETTTAGRAPTLPSATRVPLEVARTTYDPLGCSVPESSSEDAVGFSSENHKPAAQAAKGCNETRAPLPRRLPFSSLHRSPLRDATVPNWNSKGHRSEKVDLNQCGHFQLKSGWGTKPLKTVS